MSDSGVKSALFELTMVRIREFLRQGEAVFWVFGFPILMTLALGIAFRNTGPDKILVGVEDSGTASAAVAKTLEASPEMKVSVLTADAAALQLRTGKITVLVKPSADGVTYRYDPTRPESRVARLAVDDAIQRQKGRVDPAPVHDEKVTEAGARYIDFLLPGLLGLNMLGSSMWGLGFAVVEMRSKRLLKRLAATPMRRSDFLLSFIISRLIFLWLELGVVLSFAWIVFGVTIRGHWIDIAAVSLIGALAFSAIGMMIAARPTTIEGVSGWMNLVMLPMWLLSGTFFSSAKFPDVAQPFIKILPLTALNDALRAVMTEGASITTTLPQLAILAAWCVVCFVVAVRIFRWQ